MLNKKEIAAILVTAIILSFAISLIESAEIFFYTLLSIFLVIIINITAKKITAFNFDSEIEIKLWEISRYGFKAKKYFKNPFPAGAFFPIIFAVLSFGYLAWMASIIFNVKPKICQSAKRHGLYNFSEVTESQFGKIAAAGILANLAFAIIGYLIGFSEFAKLNIFYAFWNILPISDLDGNKIFFGNLVLWSFLATLILVGLSFAFLVV